LPCQGYLHFFPDPGLKALLISNRFAEKYSGLLANFFQGFVSFGETHFATDSSWASIDPNSA
jgi:hypothetical protein